MTGLVRADTELMLLAAQEMQRASSVMLEQFGSARQAMESLQSSPWSGQHRELMEERWLFLAAQFQPTATRLDDIALRLRRTAEALDGAALTFGDGAAAGSSFLNDLGLFLKSLPLPVLLSWGLNPFNPLPPLELLLKSPIGQKLLDAARGIYDPALAAPVTKLPDNGTPPLIIPVNGIGSEAAKGTVDTSVETMKEELIRRGVDEADIFTPSAVYNTNLRTELKGTNFNGSNFEIPRIGGTKLGGWLTPIDYLSSGGAWVTNGVSAGINSKTKAIIDGVNAFTGASAAVINKATETGNTAVGVAQTQNEHIFGENGPYTQQVLNEIKAKIASDPLLKGKPVELVGHSGGGAIVANLAAALEKGGIPVTTVHTMGSPVSNYDLASQYADVNQMRDDKDLVGTPIVRSSESRFGIPAGYLQMGAALNPLLPVLNVLDNDQKWCNTSPNITSVTTHSGEQDIGHAHSSYWTNDEVYKQILADYPVNMPQTQPVTPNKQGATR